MQHFGAERLALDLACHEMVEQRRDRASRGRPGYPPERLIVVLHGEPRRTVGASGTLQHAPLEVLDRHGHAERPGDGVDQRTRLLVPSDDLPEGDARHQSASTSRAFASSASGSNGLVM